VARAVFAMSLAQSEQRSQLVRCAPSSSPGAAALSWATAVT
jgi:hypothetical protein